MRPRPRVAGSHDLPEPCRRCTYWELPQGHRGPEIPDDDEGAREAKAEWWEGATLEWQPVGLVVPGDGERDCAGFAVLGPPHRFPRAGRLGGTSPDALLLAMLWADENDERVVSSLVRAALSAAAFAGSRALEAFASRRPGEACHPSVPVLEAAGFTVHRHRRRYPLMRLDVRQTPGVRDRAAEALRGLREVVPQRRGAPSMPATSRN